MSLLRRIDYNVLVVLFLAFFVFIVNSICSILDDNRLTSWQWVFAGADAADALFVLIPCITVAVIISRTSFLERSPAAILFIVSFLASALFWREPEVIVDASRYFMQAKYLAVYGVGNFFMEWGGDINIWTDMPLVPFLYGLIFKLFGESRLYIQIFTTFLFSMTVVVTYLIGRELWNKEIGLYAGLLLLGIPYLLTQVPLMLVDVPAMFFLALSIYAFIKAMNKGGWHIIFSSVAIFLAFFSKYSAWLMLSVMVVIFPVFLKMSPSSPSNACSANGGRADLPANSRKMVLYRGAGVALISALLAGIVFWCKSDVFTEQIGLLISYQKPGLRRWGESFISTFFFQIHPFITVSAIYSVYLAVKKKDIKYVIISWLIVLMLLLQIKRIRYIIMIFPLLTLMASYGLQGLKDRRVIRLIVLCAVVFSLTVGISAYLPFLQKMSAINLKHAGEFIDSIEGERVEVFVLPQEGDVLNPAVSVPLLDLFVKKKLSYYYDKSQVDLPEDFESSPLRFTWEYKNPEYYAAISPHPEPLSCYSNDIKGQAQKDSGSIHPRKKTALAIIAAGADQEIPDYIKDRIKCYAMSRVFSAYEDVFTYKTVVTVYYD